MNLIFKKQENYDILDFTFEYFKNSSNDELLNELYKGENNG